MRARIVTMEGSVILAYDNGVKGSTGSWRSFGLNCNPSQTIDAHDTVLDSLRRCRASSGLPRVTPRTDTNLGL